MTFAVSSVLNFCIVLEQVSLLMVQPSCSSFYKAFFLCFDTVYYRLSIGSCFTVLHLFDFCSKD